MLEFSHKRHQLQDVALQLTRHMSPIGNSDKLSADRNNPILLLAVVAFWHMESTFIALLFVAKSPSLKPDQDEALCAAKLRPHKISYGKADVDEDRMKPLRSGFCSESTSEDK